MIYMIFNPTPGKLPSENDCVTAFAARGLAVAAFQPRTGTYPHIQVLTECGRVFEIDMLHGGGSLFEEV